MYDDDDDFVATALSHDWITIDLSFDSKESEAIDSSWQLFVSYQMILPFLFYESLSCFWVLGCLLDGVFFTIFIFRIYFLFEFVLLVVILLEFSQTVF